MTRRAAQSLALFIAFASLCLLAYSGAIESGDANRLLGAVSSLANWGDFRLDLANAQNPSTAAEVAWFPLENAGVEPGQVFLAWPLFALARVVPGIGSVHTVWLFNALITAGAGVVMTAYARASGASRAAAFLMAFALVSSTALFPYSKTFFREPLTLLLLLIAAFAAQQLQANSYRAGTIALAVLAAGALLLTRGSALFALPALVVIALPPWGEWARLSRLWANRRTRTIMIALGLSIAAGLLALAAFGTQLGLGDRYNVVARLLSASAATAPTALSAYLLSPGGSLWGTSPIVLLALPSAIIALRKGNARPALVALVAVLSFAVGYAVFNGALWFGGLSWPPRFLIPVIPLVLLATLPAFERAVARPLSLWGVALVALIVYGLWINFTAVSLPWGAYNRGLPALPETAFAEWAPGLYQLNFLRWVVLPSRWPLEPTDLAWALISQPGFFLAFAVLAITGAVLAWQSRRPAYVGGLAVAWVAITFLGLRALYDSDLRYQPDQPAVDALMPILDAETNRNDVILLSSPRYVPYFQNRSRLTNAGRIVALELQPGERSSEAMAAQVADSYSPALLTKEASRLITNFASTRDRVFLVVDGSPFLSWSTRPAERFLSDYYYPIRAWQTGDFTRLVEFYTAPAPDPFGFDGPQITADLQFGGLVSLAGVTLSEASITPGQAVGVTLWWRADAAITSRLSMGLYLRWPDGSPIVQHDGEPRAGFAPTDTWAVGALTPDHRGLRIPDALPPGEYPLWIKVYGFDPDGQVRDLPVTAGETLYDTIGVLPTMLAVR